MRHNPGKRAKTSRGSKALMPYNAHITSKQSRNKNKPNMKPTGAPEKPNSGHCPLSACRVMVIASMT